MAAQSGGAVLCSADQINANMILLCINIIMYCVGAIK